jgi:hypothetical protein
MNKKELKEIINVQGWDINLDLETGDIICVSKGEKNLKEKTEKFSPYTRPELNKILKGLCDEYIHDIFRLILRPNHQSKNSWLGRTKVRLKDALNKKTSSKRSLYFLYSAITDFCTSNSDLKLDNDQIPREMEKVSYEKYGPYINYDVDLCRNLIQSLHDMMDPNKWYDIDEINKLVDDWYKTIPKK